MSPKVLFVVGQLYPGESGGVSISLYWLLKGLYASNRLQIKTITTTYGVKPGLVPENQWLSTDYGEVIYLKTAFIFFAPEMIKCFWKEIRQADIVHLSSIFYPPSIICFFICLFFKKKIIWSTRGSIDDVEFHKKGILKKIVLAILAFFSKSAVFHTTSDDETLFARKRLGSDTKIVQITNYMALPDPVNTLKEHFFLFIGRFHPKKGIENLLYALGRSKYFMSSNFILKIAGDYENEYGKTIFELHKELHLQSKVTFLGSVTGEEKQNLLAKAYCMLMPSYSENFGVVAAEALAQYTPVVASIYTPWQSLNTYEAGFWVDNSPETLAQVIDKLITMPTADYESIVAQTRKLVDKELNVYTNIQPWLNTYINFKDV
ncbi:glycosyltransferase [Runella limosa]|uniref:glycosyltransferase n=1 Tax=Runella limosa TaxID=370978 RepID=UPI000405372E|nr:glycosyltransferase [Runella limosa]